MSDIVERLRSGVEVTCVRTGEKLLHTEAADEIERLQETKRAALRIADERSKENVELRAELEEQARLNGMGAQRELALRAELVRLRADKEAEIVRLQADQAVWVKETLRAHEELEAENERLKATLAEISSNA